VVSSVWWLRDAMGRWFWDGASGIKRPADGTEGEEADRGRFFAYRKDLSVMLR
jgi:hypothetical protein